VDKGTIRGRGGGVKRYGPGFPDLKKGKKGKKSPKAGRGGGGVTAERKELARVVDRGKRRRPSPR